MRNKRTGPVVEILFIALVISFVCFIFNLLGFSGNKTEPSTLETTLIIINNIFSKSGIRYILSNTISNFKSIEPLASIILSLIAISVLEYSGLLKHLFTPLKKIKTKYVTMIVLFVGIISTIIGDYSYAFLLPLASILYRYIGKNSGLGILTMFIGITIGYGTGLIYNYQMYELGNITELATQGVVSNYNYELLSNIFFMITSTIILTIVGTIMLERFSKQYTRNEIKDDINTSKKALKISTIVFAGIVLLLGYCVIPGLPHSGILLDKTEPTYIGKLFGPNSPLSQGLMILIMTLMIICGTVYGVISKNIKNREDFGNAFMKSFDGIKNVLVLIFFTTVLYEIIDWTNFSTVISTNIVDFIGSSNLSGLMLIIIAFLSIVLISIFIPMTIPKWNLIAPVYVPLLMRTNISPAFTQSIFLAADSVGKLFSPVYIYLIVSIGLMKKYNEKTEFGIYKTMKKVMPTILILSLVWLVIVVGWYLIGVPIGINSSITL